MTKNKLQKFADILGFPNVFENFDPDDPKMHAGYNKTVSFDNGWSADFFNNNKPLVVELACGRGEYTVGLASRYPDKNFIGVDIKGARIWKGAKFALENALENVAFLRTRIEQLNIFIKKKEISEIWITFPDPFLKKENRRLTAPKFLDLYFPLINDSGIIHLKTDSSELYAYTLEVLEGQDKYKLLHYSEDIYGGALIHPDLDLKTYYENMHLAEGKKITYISIQKK